MRNYRAHRCQPITIDIWNERDVHGTGRNKPESCTLILGNSPDKQNPKIIFQIHRYDLARLIIFNYVYIYVYIYIYFLTSLLEYNHFTVVC